MSRDSVPAEPTQARGTPNPNSLIELRREFDAFKKTAVETFGREIFVLKRQVSALENDLRNGHRRLDAAERALKKLGWNLSDRAHAGEEQK